ncbi:MAG: thiamine pyrophosphate-binding protein [Candidatus Helarchaeota archaeon]
MSEEKKELPNGGDLLIKALLAENIRYIFGIPGGQLLTMYDAVYRFGREEGLDSIMFRHEAAAAHACDAWARITGEPSVCFGTVGPGALNLIAGVGCAWSDNIPMVVLVPQCGREVKDKFTLQGGLDQITLYKPVTKYQKHVEEVEEIPDAVQKAFRETCSGKPQPVLLEIQEDALFGTTKKRFKFPEPEKYRFKGRVAGDPKLVEKACDLLLAAKKPLMIAGGGVIRSGAWDEFRELSEYLGIAAGTSVQGIGSIPSTCNTALGSAVTSIISAASQTDFVLACGMKFSWAMGFGSPLFWNKRAKIVQIDIDPTIIGRNRPVEMGIVGDCKLVLQQMLKIIKEKAKKVEEISDWVKSLRAGRESNIKTLIKKGSKDKVPIRPQRMMKDVFEFIDEDAILALDGGDLHLFAMDYIDIFKPRPPRATLTAGVGMGQLGPGLPYAIGAKLALKHMGQPDRQVVCITGDGAFMINIQELETAKRYNLPVICIIGNNRAWGMIKSGQKLFMKKRYIDVDFKDDNFAEIAKAFGCYGERVEDPNEIKPALQRAVDSKLPAVIDIIIDFVTPDNLQLMGQMGVL